MLLLAASVSTGASADELLSHAWPMWGGTPARNMASPSAHDLPTQWDTSSGENIRWTTDLGSFSYGNPVVAGERIFVGTNNARPRDPEIQGDRGVLMCFSTADGKFLWQATYEKLATGEAQDWPLQGLCSSPAVDGELVYYVTNRAEVVAADVAGFTDGENDGPITDEARQGPHDADIVWRYDMIAELGVSPRFMASSNPLVVGDLVYVGTSNGFSGDRAEADAPEAPSFLALDKRTGKFVWGEGALEGPASRVAQTAILEGQWSSPALGTLSTSAGVLAPQVYFGGGDGWLYALDPASGALAWKFDGNPQDARWQPGGSGTRNYIVGTPVFHAGRVYVAMGIDPEHGGGPGALHAIDAGGSGDVTAQGAVWSLGPKQFGRSISTVAIHDDIVYAADLDGFLHALDLATGEELWQHDMLAGVWGSPYVADGHVYLGDEDGEIAVLKAARKLEVVAENTLEDSVYGTPIAIGKTMYITTRSRLYALERQK
ncbi:MAG: PQQ-binding-like beta-propeller repeat protein [Pirellulales bacterium]|nr:PQQ-binding-like beta-propeller repeat protein [Pirellulales bacterium]